MNFPIFTGIDPIGWIVRVKKMFEEYVIHGFHEVQRAFMSLDAWIRFLFRSGDQENPDPTCKSFFAGLIQ